MGCGPRVLGRVSTARGQYGRETLVEGVDRNVDDGAKRLQKPLRLADLRASLAAKREWQPDDDALRLLVPDELRQAREPRLRGRALDHAERPSECSRRVGNRHACARGAVV